MRPQTINKLTLQRKKRMSNSNKNVKENRRETKTRIIEISSDRVPHTHRTYVESRITTTQGNDSLASGHQAIPRKDPIGIMGKSKVQSSLYSHEHDVWVSCEPCVWWWFHKCIMEPKHMFSYTSTHPCVTLPYSIPGSGLRYRLAAR